MRRGETSSRKEEKRVWKKVWALQIPNKIKHFLFKCINGAIAIKENLFRRRVTQDLLCPMCNNDCETFPHLFLECNFAQIMWRISPLGCVPSMNGQNSILKWFDNVIDRWKESQEGTSLVPLISSILWRIWKSRNEVVFKNGRPDPQHSLYMAVKDALEYSEANDSSGGERFEEPRSSEEAACSWNPPVNGLLKINFDGAWVSNEEGPKAGAGMVIRGEEGVFVAARCVNLGYAPTPLCAEAMACREALLFASIMGLDSVIMEGDSLQLVQILESKTACPTEIEVVIEDIRREMGRLRSCEVHFTRRRANGVAHVLASSGLRGDRICTWEARPPDWLSNHLRIDNHH